MIRFGVNSLRAAVTALALLTAGLAYARGKPPLLDVEQVRNAGFSAVDAGVGRATYGIDGPYFDETGRMWRMTVEQFRDNARQTFDVRINEETGQVCVREAPVGDCAVTGDVSSALRIARDGPPRPRRFPDRATKDPQGLMIALVRYHVDSSSRAHPLRSPLYVSMRIPGDGRTIDLTPVSIRMLRDTPLQLMPGSAWKEPPDGTPPATGMKVVVGRPELQPDGNYRVEFEFRQQCREICRSGYSAIVRREKSEWKVLSSLPDPIADANPRIRTVVCLREPRPVLAPSRVI